MLTLQHRVLIYRPAADVFAYLSNPANDATWSGSVLESAPEAGSGLGLGARFRLESKFLGRRTRATTVVREFEPPRLVVLGYEGLPVESASDRRECEPAGEDTLVIRTVSAQVGDFYGMPESLLHGVAQKQIELDLALLKTLLDARAEGRAPASGS